VTSEVDFGQRLKAAREAQRLYRADIADVLKLPPRIIQQLEEEQVDELPVAAFTVGYLRAYAKLLQLDGDELVQAYRALAPGLEEPKAVTGEMAALETGYLPGSGSSWHESIQTNPGGVIAAAVVAVAILIGLIIWIVWPEESGQLKKTGLADRAQSALAGGTDLEPGVAAPMESLSTNSVDTTTDTGVELPPQVASGTALLDAESERVESANLTKKGLNDETQTRRVENPQAETQVEPGAPPSDVSAGEDSTSQKRISPIGEDRLEFSFREDCWVEVKDSTGKNLYSDLNRAHTTLKLIGQAPFRVILGYAPGVEMSFNGTTVALSAHTRNNVASIMLGQ